MLQGVLLLLLLWSFLGIIPTGVWACTKQTKGWELCNPYWVHYYHSSVNWFGAAVLCLVYNVLCPVGAIMYWFYKLCTVGRK